MITSLSFHVFSNFSKKGQKTCFFLERNDDYNFKKLFDKGEEGISPFPSILCPSDNDEIIFVWLEAP